MFEGAVGRVERIGREPVRRESLSAKAPIRHLDPTLLLVSFALTVFGTLMVYSASSARLTNDGFPARLFLDRQLAFSVVGVVAMAIVATINYRRLKAWAPVALGVIAFLLLFVLSPAGSAASGAQRWISVGFFQIQPSEIAKVVLVVMLAMMLSDRRGEPSLADVARILAVVLGTGALVFLQPDLGTMLVFVAVMLGMLLVGGTRVTVLLALILAGALTFWGVLQVGLLKEYQVARLTAFLDPEADPGRTGYNLNQAKIAVGSGQVFGKGLFGGSQTNLDFVPEVHTDFIFTAVGEELGFVGATLLIGLYAIFLWRGVRIAMLSKDLFGTMLAAGIVTMFAFQIFVNIGMTIGVTPITGIPLPFISYGGSSLLTNFIATGLLLNVHMRRLT